MCVVCVKPPGDVRVKIVRETLGEKELLQVVCIQLKTT
jgi:hypothetical protein